MVFNWCKGHEQTLSKPPPPLNFFIPLKAVSCAHFVSVFSLFFPCLVSFLSPILSLSCPCLFLVLTLTCHCLVPVLSLTRYSSSPPGTWSSTLKPWVLFSLVSVLWSVFKYVYLCFIRITEYMIQYSHDIWLARVCIQTGERWLFQILEFSGPGPGWSMPGPRAWQ